MNTNNGYKLLRERNYNFNKLNGGRYFTRHCHRIITEDVKWTHRIGVKDKHSMFEFAYFKTFYNHSRLFYNPMHYWHYLYYLHTLYTVYCTVYNVQCVYICTTSYIIQCYI